MQEGKRKLSEMHWALLHSTDLFSLPTCLYYHCSMPLPFCLLSPLVCVLSCLPTISLLFSSLTSQPPAGHDRWLSLSEPGSARGFILSKVHFFLLPVAKCVLIWGCLICGVFSNTVGSLLYNLKHPEATVVVIWGNINTPKLNWIL